MEPANELLEMLLRECQASAPKPWYPSIYVKETGLDRTTLDARLDELRMQGLLRLTDWTPNNGQGYTVTPEGGQVLQSPRHLRRLRAGEPISLRLEPIEAPQRSHASPWERGEAVRAALINPVRPVVTLTLLAANIGVFLIGLSMAMQQQIAGEYLGMTGDRAITAIHSTLGSLTRYQVVAGQWWRLLSYCFVHGGLLHILMNMYFLYVVGPMVETMWGSARFLLLYLASGLVGGCGIVLANQGPRELLPTVGASGALCGLLGSMAVWVFLNRPHLGPELSSRWLRGILTNVLLIVLISMLPIVSAMGHFAGGAAGTIIAVPLVYQRFGRGLARWLGALGAAVVPLVSVAMVYGSITSQESDEHARTVIRAESLSAKSAIKQAIENVAPAFDRKANTKWFADTDKIAHGEHTVAAVREELAAAANRIGRLNIQDRDLMNAAKLAQGFVNSWLTFFERFNRHLLAKSPPSDVEFATLKEQAARANQAFRKLDRTGVLAR